VTLRDVALLALAAAGCLALVLWIGRRAVARWTRQTLLRFRGRLDRYKLVRRDVVTAELLRDPVVLEAIAEHARSAGISETEARSRVAQYAEEIVPSFNVLSYYRLGYTLSRLLIHAFYKPTVEYQDEAALTAIPKRDVVVYLMNHRSNADYVVVTFVLARVVSLSYAVGEWARTWPLEYIFKSFGSYFVRRRYREPLYHTVLERYVQLITRNRVTQGIFPEGGLTRDGSLRPPKLGLLDYIVGTLRDPRFDGDIWLVPVAINYDRVLEDRTLIAELVEGGARPGPVAQLLHVAAFFGANLVRLLTGQLRRYGRVAVSFGTPLSVREWLATRGRSVLGLPRPERLGHVGALADEMMRRIGAVIPVTPVCLGAAALLSFPGEVIPAAALFERLEELRERLALANARLVRSELPVEEVWERAWRTFRLRRLAVRAGESFVILPASRPLLEYYANAIRHLLPEEARVHLSPVWDDDPSMPRLKSPPPSRAESRS
jgi:glycerol-3-phosphate O-acyltransferase